MTIKKILALTLISIFFTIPYSRAQDFGSIRVLARINSAGPNSELTSNGHTLRPKDESLLEVLKNLSQNDEVILTGYFANESKPENESRHFTQVFIVEKIVPISLSRLGRMEDFKVQEKPLTFKLDNPYSPRGLNVSQGIAATITITASLLLLKSLTSVPQDANQESYEKGLIFSAGALATGLQVYEEMKKRSK